MRGFHRQGLKRCLGKRPASSSDSPLRRPSSRFPQLLMSTLLAQSEVREPASVAQSQGCARRTLPWQSQVTMDPRYTTNACGHDSFVNHPIHLHPLRVLG